MLPRSIMMFGIGLGELKIDQSGVTYMLTLAQLFFKSHVIFLGSFPVNFGNLLLFLDSYLQQHTVFFREQDLLVDFKAWGKILNCLCSCVLFTTWFPILCSVGPQEKWVELLSGQICFSKGLDCPVCYHFFYSVMFFSPHFHFHTLGDLENKDFASFKFRVMCSLLNFKIAHHMS